MTDTSDRKRLETEVHQTDLKEDRINEDFVESLKRYGPWVVMAILAVVLVRVWMERDANAETASRNQAWLELQTTTEPGSLDEIAVAWEGVNAVSQLARLKAGRTLLSRVAATPDMTADERAAALDDASRQFQFVVAGDDGSRASTVVAVTALNGLAAIEESRGDTEAARGFYIRSADRAEGWLDPLAAQARGRAETVDVASLPMVRPKAAPPTVGPGEFQLPPGLIPLGPGELPPGVTTPAGVPGPVETPVPDTTPADSPPQPPATPSTGP